MEKTQNSLPGINNHNSFAKIIKNLFHDDFIFSDRWYEKSKTNSEVKPEAEPEPSSDEDS